MKSIRLLGVRQNNLKNIDVAIPLGSFTVICGPSGSGKSSLAFETLFAEGQRRYIESLSNYARQFLNKAPQPDLDKIENIPPSIAIEQKNYVKTSRSTVGTTTEITDYIRLLFEKLAIPYCPNHKIPIAKESVTDGTIKAIEKLDGKRGYILAPVSHDGRVAKGKKLHQLLMKEGYMRLFIKGEVIEVTSKTAIPAENFDIVIDRVAFREDDRGRLADSIAQAYSATRKMNASTNGGRARLLATDGAEILISEENSCSICGFTFPQITSRIFNFSSPVGACTTCNGFGNILQIDERKVIPNPKNSIAQGAIEPLEMPSAKDGKKELMSYCRRAKVDTHRAWEELSDAQRKKLWSGDGDFEGIMGYFNYLETKKYKMHVRVLLSRYKSGTLCSTCNGSRLRPEVDHILLHGLNIHQMSSKTVRDVLQFLDSLTLTEQQKEISSEILKQLCARLEFLMEVGVHYLTLDRQTRTLSGGEYQRLNLANQLGMGLSQILYVLDEPTVGLHPRDNDKLIGILKKLKDLGNTLVVVEHDQDVIRESERVMEMGPGSGHLGGTIMFDGTTTDFMRDPKSLTAQYLREIDRGGFNSQRATHMDQVRNVLELKGCTGHNLKNVNVKIPLNRLVAITGVSGSGKSSLIGQTLYPAMIQTLTGELQDVLEFKSIKGADQIRNVVFVDQVPVGKSSRSNPVTYLKVYDDIRQMMASLPDSQERGYSAGFFSLNVDGGRCPVCRGEGSQTIDMMFMDDITLICEECNGKRFRKEVLEVTLNGKNIDDILNLTVSEALDFFINHPPIRRVLNLLKEVGLEYIKLGQSARTLSGGESQRLKLAKEFAQSNQKQTLYILDEPTTGLHFREVEMLVNVLNRLVDVGGSVIVIEHNMEVIRSADYVIEMGPEGGEGGGRLLYAGTPEGLADQSDCPTAPYLARFKQKGKLKPRPADLAR